MRLLLFLATGLALLFPAAALAGPSPVAKRAVAATATAHRAAGDARVFEVRIRGRASAIVVCDVDPIVCRVAKRRSAHRWRAVLPSGPTAPGVPASPGRVPGPTPIAGEGPSFRIVVYAYQGPRFTRRDFGGRYSGA